MTNDEYRRTTNERGGEMWAHPNDVEDRVSVPVLRRSRSGVRRSSFVIRHCRAVLLFGVYAVPVLAAVRPVTDPDLWWHLRVGEWVIENGRVPANDPFSAHG